MKNKTLKTVLNFVIKHKQVLLILGLIATSFFGIKGCVQNKKSLKLQTQAIINKDNKIIYWKDRDSIEHAKSNLLIITEKSISAFYKEQVKELTNKIQIKDKQITEYTTLITKNNGKIITKVDTIYLDNDPDIINKPIDYVTVEYKDKWMDFKGKIKNEQFTADYSLTDSINIIGYWEKTGFLKLGKKNYYLDISANNPNVTIQNARNFRVTSANDNKIGVGIIGGYGLSIDKNIKSSSFIGIGLYYRLF